MAPTIVNVTFNLDGGKTYAYYTDIPDLVPGDLVVVVSPKNTMDTTNQTVFDAGSSPPSAVGAARIVRVVSTDETVEGIEQAREWIVARLDFSDYLKRRAKKAKRDLLLAKIRRARTDAFELFEMSELASKSPALAGLLNDLKALDE